jgi:hypothetical protein
LETNGKGAGGRERRAGKERIRKKEGEEKMENGRRKREREEKRFVERLERGKMEKKSEKSSVGGKKEGE